MKFYILFLFLTVSQLTLNAQSSNNSLKISRLTGDFYIYTTWRDLGGFMFPSNSLYLVTDSGVIMIDTPWDTTQFQPLLDSIKAKHNKQVVMCLSTHHHDDRTAGLGFLRERNIKTWSTDYTRQLCEKSGEQHAEFVIKGDTTFRIGGYVFETFYPGPGHSEDNIVVWFGKERILYGGCFIKSYENSGLGNLADADPEEWMVSLLKTMSRYPDPEFVIPGHFDWRNNGSAEHTFKLLNDHAGKKWISTLGSNDLLILASLVEAETTLHSEKPRVAGVYLNRLNAGMMLQSDASVLYATGDTSKRRLMADDLKRDSPYNTYKYKGLPPGVITVPGEESIRAVLNPAQGDHLFFCPNPLLDGTFNYATSYKDHQKNVELYIKAMKSSKVFD